MPESLRSQLLAWVLIPLMGAIGVDAWLTYKSSAETAAVVQDRLLLGSARMIAEQISFEDGTFQHQIPPAALELFQSQQLDRIFYRVTTGSGQMLAGYTDLELPKPDFKPDVPYFFNASMRGDDVRIVAFFQPVIGNPSALPVVVEVAQTMRGHRTLTQDLWLRAVEQQLLILVLASVFILYGLHRGLRPLIRLRDDVQARREGSVQRLQTKGIPSELTPLLEAFNDYIHRLEKYTAQRTIFIQNAAHQLRTPLAVLSTQISDAVRADTRDDADTSLQAARRTLQQTARTVNQFLTLSSAESYVARIELVSSSKVCDMVQRVLEEFAVQAHQKDIDLGFERRGAEVSVWSDLSALREMTTNLIDNAIRYTPNGGMVTARVQSERGAITLSVEDNGPGVPVDSRSKIFERFYRVDTGNSQGSGLGLSIVKELAAQCGASVELGAPSWEGRGFLISLKVEGMPTL